jgi:bifunctional non-homologous end joining protein LigD
VRPGKVFVDWGQNARFKTTIGVYSMRARPEPTCSTPVTWEEVGSCAEGGPELRFTWRDVLDRVDEHGDLFADVLTLQQTLPGSS